MQFLHEEFFKKIYKFINNINLFTIKIIAKIIFWGMLFGILGVLTWLYLNGKQKYVFWVVGIFLIAECAHLLRKSRERAINKKLEESSNIQEQLSNSDVIEKDNKNKPNQKVINKEGLLKKKKTVEKEKVANKYGLLKNSIKVKIIKNKLK